MPSFAVVGHSALLSLCGNKCRTKGGKKSISFHTHFLFSGFFIFKIKRVLVNQLSSEKSNL